MTGSVFNELCIQGSVLQSSVTDLMESSAILHLCLHSVKPETNLHPTV